MTSAIGDVRSPILSSLRLTVSPGVSRSTMNAVMPVRRAPDSSVA